MLPAEQHGSFAWEELRVAKPADPAIGPTFTSSSDGGVDGMARFTDHLRLCDIGVSLGDIHTLVYPQPKRGGLIRLSVGCEDVEDLLADFELGLSFVA